MDNMNTAAFAELTDAELDGVAAGSLVNINVPLAINLDLGLQEQVNTIVLSKNVVAGGGQWLSLTSLAIAKT